MRADITIETIGAQADGIGHHAGETVYIERALPQETVTADIHKDREGIWRGDIAVVVTASPDRQVAPCQYYNQCGGCNAQHMTETAYRQWKIDKVQALLAAKSVKPKQWDTPVFIPAATRRRASFSVFLQSKKLTVGYNKRRSSYVIDIDECLLLTPEITGVVRQLRAYLPDMVVERKPYDLFIQRCDNGFDIVLTGPMRGKGRHDLAFLESAAAIIRETPVIRIGWRGRERDAIETVVEAAKPMVSMGALSVPVPPQAFLQPSAAGQAALTRVVLDYLGESATGKVADLFAGCGTFTGAVIAAGGQCDAYEGEAVSVSALKQSGHRDAFVQNLFTDPLGEKQLAQYDAVITDPPRAGAKAQSETMAWSAVPKIISVSCNPVTFARDAKILTDGGYKLDRLTIVDQFIWSPHTELVGLFVQD